MNPRRLARIRERFRQLPSWMGEGKPARPEPASTEEYYNTFSRVDGALVFADRDGQTPALAVFYASAPSDVAVLLEYIDELHDRLKMT